MSEVNTPRLMAAAKEFNIGTHTLIEFLVSKNFSADDLKPSSKLTGDMYRVLQSEFQQDKVAKEKAEKVELVKTGGSAEPKKKRDEEDLSIKKKEAVKAVVVEKPVEEPKPEPVVIVEVEKPVEKAPDITNIEAPEIESPKVLDKIDLDAIDSSTRPKKGKKKTEEPAVEEAPKKEEPKKTKKAVEEAPPVVVVEVKVEEVKKDTTPIIENIQARKLTGPKIMGK
ncbi:MAG: translation initiation factor IF-2, partial [Chitinophagaceae bacterium]